MESKLFKEIRKIDSDCIVEKSLDERTEEIKKKYGVETIEEMVKLVEKTISRKE